MINSEKNQLTKIEEFTIKVVKEYRIKRGFSQSQLADLLNVSRGFIGNVESCKYPTKYNLNHLNSLAKIFECSPKDFLPQNPIEND